MYIVIMGCGRVGSSLARGLEARGHSVAVIDAESESFRRLGPGFKGLTVMGVGYDRQVLERAGIRKACGFAAVSNGDNSNILAARTVRELYHIDNVVARIYDQGRAEVYERLGIPTVATVRWTSNQIIRRLLSEGSEPVWQDPSGNARLIQVAVHSGWVGRRISQMSDIARTPLPFLLRFGQGFVTGEQTIFQDGDILYVAAETQRTSELETLFGQPPTRR